MVKPFRETETERMYLLEYTERDGVGYAHVRTYRLTDRWRRTKDQWYRIDDKLKRYKADFDIRQDYPE